METRKPEREGLLIVRELGDEVLVLDTTSNRIHKLNRTAGIIWRGAAQARLAEEIARELALEFDVEPAEALGDVLRTMEELRTLQLLENGAATEYPTGST